jgi:signal transduction histidine kinase
MHLLRTTAFRWALVYLALFILSVTVILGFVYWNTTSLMKERMDADIRAESAALLGLYRSRGPGPFLERLRERVSGAGEGLYLLTDFTGRPIAGNLERLPPGAGKDGGWVEFTFEAQTPGGFETHAARAQVSVVTGGFRLLVGHDINQLRRFGNMMRRVLVVALILSVLLGLGGGIMMSRNMLRRIESINRTSRAIMQGDFTQRIPLKGADDEIDALAQNLNAMLDQIAQLMQGLREVSENIAHDLKTPLTRLQARLEDLTRNGNLEPEAQNALEESIGDARNLIEIFNALLSIARTQAGSGNLERHDLSALMADVAELYEPLAQDKNIEFALNVPPGIIATIDRQLIAQAIANLLDNALKYAGGEEVETPKVTLSLTRGKTGLSIRVCDNGPGIPPDEYEHVLERFVRLDQSRTHPGSGLGLSLVVAVARLHRGAFALGDNNPGLCAALTLPAGSA